MRAYIARQAGDVARADVGGLAGSGEASVDVGRLRVGGHRVEEGEGGGASDDGEGHGDCANACEKWSKLVEASRMRGGKSRKCRASQVGKRPALPTAGFSYSGWTEAPPMVFDTYKSAFGGVAGSGTTSDGAREMLAGGPVSDGGGGPVLLGGPCSLVSLPMLDACGRSGSSEAR